MVKLCIRGNRVRECAGLRMPAVLTKWRETGVQFSVLTTAIGAYPIVKECYSAERYVITFLTIWPTQSLITERILKWLAPWCIGDKWLQSALSPALWRPTWIETIFIKTFKKTRFITAESGAGLLLHQRIHILLKSSRTDFRHSCCLVGAPGTRCVTVRD